MLIQNKAFKGASVESPLSIHGVTFDACTFNGGSIGMYARSPDSRMTVTQCAVKHCVINGTSIGPVIFRDCHVDGLESKDVVWISGAAFSRCVFSGRLGSFIFFEEVDLTDPRSSPVNKAIINHNKALISQCDWCLDVSKAEFEELDLRSVPAEKVLVNNKTQVRVNYSATEHALKDGSFDGRDDKSLIEEFVEAGEDSRYNFIIATSRYSRTFKRRLGLIEFLSASGLLLRDK